MGWLSVGMQWRSVAQYRQGAGFAHLGDCMTARCTAVTLSVVLLLAGAGCTPNKPSAGGTSNAAPPQGPAGTIPVGPGPQATYTVQAQPAPGRCHYRHTAAGEPLPDPACTPGARNPQVTQATIRNTICKSGWTATIRPPSSVTAKEKKGSLAAYAYVAISRTGGRAALEQCSVKCVHYECSLWIEHSGPVVRPHPKAV